MRNVEKQTAKYFIVLALGLCILNINVAQECFDADFESGSIGGYETYYGEISRRGIINFNTQALDINQHKIMAFEHGIDTIAEKYCIENSLLPVAGQSRGKYSLRLGDALGGNRTSKVVLSLNVTQYVSFFLLQYAVVLENPSHDEVQQPRFELNIKDEAGNHLDCGTYSVAASDSLSGFEKCGEWLVRPWTAAGFELKSYIGQTINIELFTTDCALGGHGGYAYIDATCKPLELTLDNYCPGNPTARYFITEGFDSYLWNTGDETNKIEIIDPVPGDIYQVTVTSSTGCTLVLKDTIPEVPEIEDLIPSYFFGSDTLEVCNGESIIYKPSGENIGIIEAIELGYSAEQFNIYVSEDQVIRFVTKDNFGCIYDTMELKIYVKTLNVDFNINHSCLNSDDGNIEVLFLDSITGLISINNSPFRDNLYFDNLGPGIYTITIQGQNGCHIKSQIQIVELNAPYIHELYAIDATCGLDNGQISLFTFDHDAEFSLNNEGFTDDTEWFNLTGGTHLLEYRVPGGCIAHQLIEIKKFEKPVLDITYTDSIYCAPDNGIIDCNVLGGKPPYLYNVSGNFISQTSYSGLVAGTYEVIVKDRSHCYDTLEIDLHTVPYITLKEVEQTSSSCNENNGRLNVIVNNENLLSKVYLNEEAVELKVNDLASGMYTLVVEDLNGCIDKTTLEIGDIPPPEFTNIDYQSKPCGTNQATVIIEARTYTDGISYAMNNLNSQKENVFQLPQGEHTIHTIDDLGCDVSTIITIPEIDRHTLPNIFSPNNDGSNDQFCFHLIDSIILIEFINIYDRMGNRVYAVQNKTPFEDMCWDGKYNGKKVSDGVYIYQLQLRLKDGRLMCKSGDVTVI